MDRFNDLEILIDSWCPVICIETAEERAEIGQSIVSALYTVFSARNDLSTDAILQELHDTRPLSLVMKEQIDYLRQWAQGRTVPAS
ncbi:MAG TPA: hypothetical protein VFG19_04530 [Geobacteraceae bacterium]|nr:hypothetical protein [Geobacteraceae bacterium]